MKLLRKISFASAEVLPRAEATVDGGSTRADDLAVELTPFLALLAALTFATWLGGEPELRFSDTGAVAFEAGFPGAAGDWRHGGRDGEIELDETSLRFDGTGTATGDARGALAYLSVELDPADGERARFLAVSGTVSPERTPRTLPAAHSAAFLVWFLDERNDSFGYRTVGLLRDGLPDGRRLERTVAVPREARRLVVALDGRDSDGAFSLSDVVVEGRIDGTFYEAIRTGLLIGWSALFGFALLWLARRSATLVALSVAVPLALTFAGILAPESVSGPLILAGERWLSPMLAASSLTFPELLFKGGHFIAFLSLSIASFASRGRLRASAPALFAALVLLALGTEGLQLHLVGRTTRLSDIAIDLAAVIAALGFIRGLEGRRRPPGASA